MRTRVLPRDKHGGPRCFRKPGHGGTHRGAKIVDPFETNAYDHLSTPEVNKVREALKTSSFELHAVVKDPLEKALRIAKSLKLDSAAYHHLHDFGCEGFGISKMVGEQI